MLQEEQQTKYFGIQSMLHKDRYFKMYLLNLEWALPQRFWQVRETIILSQLYKPGFF